MGAAIWSMSLADMLEFPLEFFVRFFKNHGLLSVSERPQWYVVEGGSSAYIEPLTRAFSQRIRLNCPVFEVARDKHGVTVHSPAGAERFDKVVFACHSDQALKLLAEPTSPEWEILGAIGYADNEVVLHTDTRLLPRRRRAWASWNYRLGGPSEQLAAVTYNMNILQGIDAPETFCVSLNQSEAIDPEQVLARFTYAHPQYSLAGIAAQARAEELLGARHSYFCGAYWGNGFHETAWSARCAWPRRLANRYERRHRPLARCTTAGCSTVASPHVRMPFTTAWGCSIWTSPSRTPCSGCPP